MALHAIEIKTEAAKRGLDRIVRQELPFAFARGLTELARQSRISALNDVKRTFRNTTPWYNPGSPIGIKTLTATKKNLESAVYSRAYFGPLQVLGGTKRPKKGTHLAIPSQLVRGRPNRWAGGARKALEKDRTFIVHAADGRSFIFRRTGRGRNSKTVLLYTLVSRARIRAEWKILEVAKKVFQRRGKEIFQTALAQAVRSRLK